MKIKNADDEQYLANIISMIQFLRKDTSRAALSDDLRESLNETVIHFCESVELKDF